MPSAGKASLLARTLSDEEHASSRDYMNQVWTFDSLQLLHGVSTPTWISKTGFYQDEHRVKDICECLFANHAATRLFGEVCSPEASQAMLRRLTDAERENRRSLSMKAMQLGDRTAKSWVKTHKLLPLHFTAADKFDCASMLVMYKQIKIRRAEGMRPEVAVLCEMCDKASADNKRIVAMLNMSPIISFLFDAEGNLVHANSKGLQKYGHLGHDGLPLTLLDLFRQGVYEGGEEEAFDAYEEAMEAIFGMHVASHRHTQSCHSKKRPGQLRHVMIEMWPMADPVYDEPTVLVSLFNVTSQKELEGQLKAHKELLQRQNQDLTRANMHLESHNVKVEAEKQVLQDQKELLAQNLEAVMADRLQPKQPVDTDTPVDKTQAVLRQLMLGIVPPINELLGLYNMITQCTDLRQPVQLEKQLLESEAIDEDVGRSIYQLLQGNHATAPLVSGSDSELQVLARTCSALSGPESVQRSEHSSEAPLEVEFDLPMTLLPEMERVLQGAQTDWHYSVFALADAAGSFPLSLLTFHFIASSGLVQELRLNDVKLGRFLRRIEQGYGDNPYHNRTHAADVVQTMHMLLHYGGLRKHGVVDKVTTLASYIAAAVHDFEHRGVNNDFLIKTKDCLAVTYNDQSPLENHHLAASFRLLLKPQFNFLEHLSKEEQTTMRTAIIDEVLATDMKRHFNTVSRFQSVFQRRETSGSKDVFTRTAADPSSDQVNSTNWAKLTDEERSLARQLAIKCADIGHLAASQANHKRWAYQLEEEFFRQGEKEKANKLPVSALMDRSNRGGITRSQVGFFSIVGMPMFRTFVDVFDGATPLLEAVLENYDMWVAAVNAGA